MAARNRRRRRTFSLTLSLPLRLGRGRASAASERKRAAKKQERGTRISWSRIFAWILLVGCAGLLGWFFVDVRFYISETSVEGNVLVDNDALHQASDLNGYSIFYIDRAEIADRIRAQVTGIEQVYVQCRLPNELSILIAQGDVRFIWRTAGTAYLVDGAGLVLQSDDGAHGGLLSILDLDDRPLRPGEHVTMQALTTVERLHSLLPEIRVFEYSEEMGVSLHDARGWRIYFGDDRALAEKVASMRALLQRISSKGETAKLIDLRFVGSPYYE